MASISAASKLLAAAVGFVIHDARADMRLLCALQAGGPGTVTDDRAQLEGAAGIACVVDDGLQVAAATGNQHYDAEFPAAHA